MGPTTIIACEFSDLFSGFLDGNIRYRHGHEPTSWNFLGVKDVPTAGPNIERHWTATIGTAWNVEHSGLKTCGTILTIFLLACVYYNSIIWVRILATQPHPSWTEVSFLVWTMTKTTCGSYSRSRRFRKMHFENILPRASWDRDPRYPMGVPWD